MARLLAGTWRCCALPSPSPAAGRMQVWGAAPGPLKPLVPRLSPWRLLHRLGKGKLGPGPPVTACGKETVAGITPASPVPEMQPPLGWDPAATCIPPYLPPSAQGGIFFLSSFFPTSLSQCLFAGRRRRRKKALALLFKQSHGCAETLGKIQDRWGYMGHQSICAAA